MNSAVQVQEQEAIEPTKVVTDPIQNTPFLELFKKFKKKALPLIDSTNFDNFHQKNFLTREDVNVLQLTIIYPNFFKVGYEFRASPSYKITFSKAYYTLIFIFLKGDHEMESVLVNYDLNGKLIDFKVIAYDEIAEGWSRIESKIEKYKLTITNIFWAEEKEVTTTVFVVDTFGKIRLSK